MVSEARRVLSFNQLPEDAQPPKSIWHSIKKCEEFVKSNFGPGKKPNKGELLEFHDDELENAN